MIAYPRAGEGAVPLRRGSGILPCCCNRRHQCADRPGLQQASLSSAMDREPRRVTIPGCPSTPFPRSTSSFLSHNHYDHLDRACRESASPRRTRRVGGSCRCDSVTFDPGASTTSWSWTGGRQSRGQGVRITATPARHFSGRGLRDRNRSLCAGLRRGKRGARFFAGDTAYHPEFGQIGSRRGPFDFVMIPIGDITPRLVHADVARGPGRGGADLTRTWSRRIVISRFPSCSVSTGGAFG